LIVSILLGGVISQLFGLIKVIQIIMLQAVIAIVYPAELTYFYSLVVSLAEFDLF
jgi:hypothetical protein